MRVAVLGPVGFGGSHVCVELLNRGHEVIGISRSPGGLGENNNYHPINLDLLKASVKDVVDVLDGVDVLINCYNPPGRTENTYRSFIEVIRKLVVASKAVKLKYFIMVGGTASLHIPSSLYDTGGDSREWWLAVMRGGADGNAAFQHTIERYPAVEEGLRAYRNARIALREGKAEDTDRLVIKEMEDPVLYGENPIRDLPLSARASYQMFDGNTSFKWTFVSPPSRYRPGPRTGKYEVHMDYIPMRKEAIPPSMDGNAFEGRLLGISVADLAVAIVDEMEKEEKVGRHWSATSEWDDDVPMESYVKI